MAKNKYRGLSTNQTVSLAREEMKVFREKWAELTDETTYVARMAKEYDRDMTPLMKAETLNRGLLTLKNLTDAHFARKKPGFFSMLFRTKAAQEYRKERREINEIAKTLKEVEEKNPDIVGLSSTGVTITCAPVSVDSLTQRQYFASDARDLEKASAYLRSALTDKFNGADVNMQRPKDQYLLEFMRDYDKQIEEAEIPDDPEFEETLEESTNLESKADAKDLEGVGKDAPDLSNNGPEMQ